jgi:Alginate lyase
VARHTLPRGHHVRYALPQPVTRHAVEDDALVVAGSVPVRRGIAVVAVVGGALSAAGAAVVVAAPQPRNPAEADPAIGLAADSKPASSSTDKQDDLADESPVLDYEALAKAVLRASDEGRRLAAEDQKNGEDQKKQDQEDPAVSPGLPTGTASMPGQLIDPHDWYLTLPTGKKGSPDTIDGSKLATYHSEFFDLNAQRNGIVFHAGTDGVTTKNSHYPRSELREMNGGEKASWSNETGTHEIDVREAFTKLPDAKPEVVGVQIHDASDDVLQIRLEGKTLMVQYHDGKSEAVLDPNYQLGTPFDTRIVAADGKVDVFYNGAKKAELPLSGSGWYWKVGAYVQSNGSHGDGADSAGEVTVYRADVKAT